MQIRRTITTALAAGTLAASFALAAPAAHAVPLPAPVIQINPCVLLPGSCTPDPTVPKGPGDLTQVPPCLTHACPPPPTVPPVTVPPTQPDPSDPGTSAQPATPVKATAAFTG